ncbi:MAG TPA: M20/M25/M40 family metallo-hydrolase [Pyrinomonadaceae bacterium]|jgi:acetylornithine deacetylase|nr:M20/M25/M40 family metallo-hydrolase [Pyrinomonadaceae bacterium]
MDLFELTKKLIDIPSVTGDERAVGEFLLSYLEGLGYKTERQEVERDRFNILATTNTTPRVVLSTHMDTVPPHIGATESDEKIYGRGACDAKGIMAAQITAAQRLSEQGIAEIGLLFTVDEEQGSLGAQSANRFKLAKPPEYLLNGEPTDNKLASATKGSLRLKLCTRGRPAHSAYPEAGESAVEKLLDVLKSIRECAWPADDELGQTTCNIGIIGGGTRANVVPAEAFADLQLRLVTETEPIRKILERAIAGRAEVQYLSEHEPVRLHTVPGFERCVVRFTTDIPYLSNWGKPLLLGPGSILNAHTEHEFVEKQELIQAVDLYAELARALLARKSTASHAPEGASQ